MSLLSNGALSDTEPLLSQGSEEGDSANALVRTRTLRGYQPLSPTLTVDVLARHDDVDMQDGRDGVDGDSASEAANSRAAEMGDSEMPELLFEELPSTEPPQAGRMDAEAAMQRIMNDLRANQKPSIDVVFGNAPNSSFALTTVGVRNSNEDRAFFFFEAGLEIYVVLDGHGGHDVVNHIVNTFPAHFKALYDRKKIGKHPSNWARTCLSDACDAVQREIVERKMRSGACFLAVAYDRPKKVMYRAHVGDCRMYTLDSTKPVLTARTVDHTVQQETERLRKAGANIIHGRVYDQGSMLGIAVGRALGDIIITDVQNNPVLYASPTVATISAENMSVALLVTDGVTNGAVYDKNIQDLFVNIAVPPHHITVADLKKTATKMCEWGGSFDNSTVIVIRL